jgi:hypothetical protein
MKTRMLRCLVSCFFVVCCFSDACWTKKIHLMLPNRGAGGPGGRAPPAPHTHTTKKKKKKKTHQSEILSRSRGWVVMIVVLLRFTSNTLHLRNTRAAAAVSSRFLLQHQKRRNVKAPNSLPKVLALLTSSSSTAKPSFFFFFLFSFFPVCLNIFKNYLKII